MILQPVFGGRGGGGALIEVANCDPGDLVGDAVYVSTDKVSGLITVTKVNIDSSTGNESVSVGVIISKSDPSTCRVQFGGTVEGLYTGLTPGNRIFVNESSRLQDTPPDRPTTGKRVMQEVAYALASDLILINPLSPIRVRPL